MIFFTSSMALRLPSSPLETRYAVVASLYSLQGIRCLICSELPVLQQQSTDDYFFESAEKISFFFEGLCCLSCLFSLIHEQH